MDNPSKFPQWQIEGEELYACPKGMVTHESAEWLRYYSHYSKNMLPVAGGIIDQTARFVAAMEIIEITKAGL